MISKQEKIYRLKQNISYKERIRNEKRERRKEWIANNWSKAKDNNPTSFKTKYSNFLRSAYWLSKRRVILEKRGNICEICRSSTGIQVHHISYENAFKQNDKLWENDVVLVCKFHHEDFHSKFVLKKNMKEEWGKYKKSFQ